MQQLTESQLYQLFIETLKKHKHEFVHDHHDVMLRNRFKSKTIDEILHICYDNINFEKSIDIIELGCSFGFLSFINMLFGNQQINSWTGYDIDSKAVAIANDLKQQLDLKNTKFIHSAVSSIKDDTTSTAVDNRLLAMELSHLSNDVYETRQIPNTNYKNLSACDIILIDIEGEELNIDLNYIDFKICVLETNNTEATDMYQNLKYSHDKINMLTHKIFTNPYGIKKGEFVFLNNRSH